MDKNERSIGIDIVKTIAIFSVISVHFFLNSGFYEIVISVSDLRIVLAVFFRYFFVICVPLFLIITGFLMKKKKLTISYYKGIWKILVTYILISVLTFFVRKYYLGDEVNWIDGIKGLLFFGLNGYAWYVNMYIGLFLLIPFLNILYYNLEKKNQIILLLILIFLTSLKVTPDWWKFLFPLTYYFIGVFVGENGSILKKRTLLWILLATLTIQTILCFLVSQGSFFRGIFGLNGDFPTLVVTTCVFLLFYDINIKGKVKNIFILFSKYTLEIYLVSYFVDRCVYSYLREYYNTLELIPYFIIIVLFILGISLLIAVILNPLQKIILQTIIK